MPRIVDREERRESIVRVACELIARNGIEATTVRSVAKAAGCSTKVVSHYFTNKHELLLLAYRTAAEAVRSSVISVLSKDPSNLGGTLLALMPLDTKRRSYWHIWFEFRGMSVGDLQFGKEHRRHLRLVLQILVDVLQARYRRAVASAAMDPQMEAQRLIALVSGLASIAVFDSGLVSNARQQTLIESEVAGLDRLHL